MTPDSSRSTAVRIVGGLLIAQAAARLGLLIFNFASFQLALQRQDMFLVMVVFVIPIVLGIAAGVVGIMMVQLLPAARCAGIAVCATCLAYQIYGLGTLLYRISTIPSLRLNTMFLMLPVAYIAVFVAGLIVLFRWHPSGASRT